MEIKMDISKATITTVRLSDFKKGDTVGLTQTASLNPELKGLEYAKVTDVGDDCLFLHSEARGMHFAAPLSFVTHTVPLAV